MVLNLFDQIVLHGIPHHMLSVMVDFFPGLILSLLLIGSTSAEGILFLEIADTKSLRSVNT